MCDIDPSAPDADEDSPGFMSPAFWIYTVGCLSAVFNQTYKFDLFDIWPDSWPMNFKIKFDKIYPS